MCATARDWYTAKLCVRGSQFRLDKQIPSPCDDPVRPECCLCDTVVINMHDSHSLGDS